MSEEITKDGLKVRKLIELNTATGQEYQDVMLKRVDEFAQKYADNSIFNSFIQNTVVKGLSTILDLKIKVDEMLGNKNIKTVHDLVDKILLFGL